MPSTRFETFWDVERERTWRIYILFGILILFYFVPIYTLWLFVKLIIHTRQAMYAVDAPFSAFGWDTVIVILFAGGVSTVHWFYSNKRVVRKTLVLLGARQPDRSDRYHAVFTNVVDEICAAAGGMQVEPYIIPTGAMNAFALADLYGHEVVGITEGLLSRVTRDELQAVVAHEIAHIVSNDCVETTVSCALFDMYSEALSQFNRMAVRVKPLPDAFAGEGPHVNITTGAMASLPVVVLFFITDTLGHFLKMLVSREREYRADAAAVRLTRHPLSLARVLYKIGTHWRGAGADGEHLAPIFIMNPRYSKLDEHEDMWATFFSTHPPLIKRLNMVLQLAHADLDTLRQHMYADEGLKQEAEIKRSEAHFFLEREGTWQGPYTLMQLQSCAWLERMTQVRSAGSEYIVAAQDIPTLRDFFKKQTLPVFRMRRLCPDCREWLVPQEYEGLYVWQCAFCSGILVEGEKLPRIFVRREKGFGERIIRLADIMRENFRQKKKHVDMHLAVSHPRQCPKCGKSMLRKFYSYAYHVEVDTCRHCSLTWFDADELELLQCLIELEEKKSR
jgi:Zn-dependent protease with chaperone function/Zn-finger nucleic acid-binding protein